MAADDDEFARWIFLLGAEAAELEIGWDGLVYTVDDDSTIQETRDFDGVTKTIGPYYLSERAQHIKDEFIVPVRLG